MNPFDKDYVLTFIREILAIDSPSGFTARAMNVVSTYADELGYQLHKTTKGNGVIDIPGKSAGTKTIGLCAHIDTLGLMVSSINSNGTLAFTRIGGPVLPTLDGEYCKIYTRDGTVYTGTILLNNPSSHVNKESSSMLRGQDNMHVRLDNVVKTKNDTKALGIMNGDYICYDPKTVITPTDFIKSRFLDDKLSIGVIFGVLKYLRDNSTAPEYNVKVIFSANEEIGHGMSYIPSGITELLAVDMGCVGNDLSCTEFDVSICVKDSSGPYDYELTTRLINLAKKNNIHFAADVYPYYSSDVSAALSAGNDIKGALIGPGVHASHGMERSHYEAVDNAMKLVLLYLCSH